MTRPEEAGHARLTFAHQGAQIEKSGSFSVAVYIFERLSLCISCSSKEEPSYARVYDLISGLDIASCSPLRGRIKGTARQINPVLPYFRGNTSIAPLVPPQSDN